MASSTHKKSLPVGVEASDQDLREQRSALLSALHANLSYQTQVRDRVVSLRGIISDNRSAACRLSHALGVDLRDRELLGRAVSGGAGIGGATDGNKDWFKNRLDEDQLKKVKKYLTDRTQSGSVVAGAVGVATNTMKKATAFPELKRVRRMHRYYPILSDAGDPRIVYPSLYTGKDRTWKRRFLVDGWDETDHPHLPKTSQSGEAVVPPGIWKKWTRDETDALKESVREQIAAAAGRTDRHQNSDGAVGTESIDFEHIAARLGRRSDASALPRLPLRSAAACRAKYRSLVAGCLPTAPAAGQGGTGRRRHDWIAVARDAGAGATPWQIFVHSRRRPPPPGGGGLPTAPPGCDGWTVAEDGLLLKHVARHGGPRMAVSATSGLAIARRALPQRTGYGVQKRAHKGSYNPNYFGTDEAPAELKEGGDRDENGKVQHRGEGKGRGRPWTEVEERRLVLCMRIYKNYRPSAVAGAAMHFPLRQPSSLWEKWNRNLDPSFSRSPWTAEDDRKLLDAVETVGQHNFKEIANLFPNRTKKQLLHRWNEIVPIKQLLNRWIAPSGE
mmetsp:Transcript_20263/g.40444  ORF Transcript_20263/g.40444 Transcript_20263/m.40444 type:complete len:558 (+) Transcript_20263:51-1724(+)